jgi:hypothetical protein
MGRPPGPIKLLPAEALEAKTIQCDMNSDEAISHHRSGVASLIQQVGDGALGQNDIVELRGGVLHRIARVDNEADRARQQRIVHLVVVRHDQGHVELRQ